MMPRAWLKTLKLDQLHRLASLTGSYCSGNKSTRIAAIEKSVQNAATVLGCTTTGKNQNGSIRSGGGGLRIVSIDMGIRNLAYCTLQAQPPHASSSSPDIIQLGAWQRVEVNKTIDSEDQSKDTASISSTKEVKESFEPYDYAKHAYSLIKGIIDEHNPTHVLIERQRFRSGGGAAVQEWTIRVGVFEAMLYATLRTLKEQNYCTCAVAPVAPAMVNRFWIQEDQGGGEEGGDKVSGHPGNAKKRKGTDIKQRKIRLLQGILRKDVADGAQLVYSKEALQRKEDFLSPPQGSGSQLKLDDLTDSLLQGLAWISWQRNRLNLDSVAEREIGEF